MPGKRVELLDRRVAAVHDDRAGVEQRTERIRPVGLAGPVLVGEVAIGRRVRELHGAGDAELGEADEILGREQLCVLDPVPEPERSPCVPGLLERVERLTVRAIADRVDGDRKPRRGSAPHDLGELVAARDLDPATVEHPGRPRTERSVHEHLQVAEPARAGCRTRSAGRRTRRRPVRREVSTARRAGSAGRARRAAATVAVHRASRPCRGRP